MNKNGFVIEIINSSDDIKKVELFTEKALNEYIIVHTRNNEFQYEDILEIARTKNFRGTGIKIDHDEPIKLCIHNSGSEKQFDFLRFIEEIDVLIDGKDNYISIEIPPKNEFIIQLY